MLFKIGDIIRPVILGNNIRYTGGYDHSAKLRDKAFSYLTDIIVIEDVDKFKDNNSILLITNVGYLILNCRYANIINLENKVGKYFIYFQEPVIHLNPDIIVFTESFTINNVVNELVITDSTCYISGINSDNKSIKTNLSITEFLEGYQVGSERFIRNGNIQSW